MSTTAPPAARPGTGRRRCASSSLSAAVSSQEMHVDGLRVDLTQAIHRDNAPRRGRSVGSANLFGQKLLREWSDTLTDPAEGDAHRRRPHRLGRGDQPADQGGLGFDATWDAEFYHSLIGDSRHDPPRAAETRRLRRKRAARNGLFSGALAAARQSGGFSRVARRGRQRGRHGENHRGRGQRRAADRRHPPLAEARAHFAAGCRCSAPARRCSSWARKWAPAPAYTFGDFLAPARTTPRAGRRRPTFPLLPGAHPARLAHPRCDRAPATSCTHERQPRHRLQTLERRRGGDRRRQPEQSPVSRRLPIHDPRIPDAGWKEVFNSDAAEYGGSGLLNGGQITSGGGSIAIDIPANSVLVLQRQ